jgi:hypothetical protein
MRCNRLDGWFSLATPTPVAVPILGDMSYPHIVVTCDNVWDVSLSPTKYTLDFDIKDLESSISQSLQRLATFEVPLGSIGTFVIEGNTLRSSGDLSSSIVSCLFHRC